MKITESCKNCLLDKQKHLSENKAYIRALEELLEQRAPEDSAPYMLYRFREIQERFGVSEKSYGEIKKKYNDLVLEKEASVRSLIESAEDPLRQALLCSRIGNYIDFGAMNEVDEETFLALFSKTQTEERERGVMESFFRQCGRAESFLLITDNCGEIVLDRLFLEQLRKTYPELKVTILVRGGEVLNDATEEDARYVGLDQVGTLVNNGLPVAGTVYELLPKEIQELIDHTDVILAKGQGNYETLAQQGKHVFYSFLCKCDHFTDHFKVPKLTGMFIEE